jgi:cytochrome c oxidase cbb3-type subunit III
MSDSNNFLVIVLTLLNILGCLWLMWWTARSRGPTDEKGASLDGSTPGKTGHVWDQDIEEYNNPMPRWWLGLFVLTIVFALAYLVFYPGLGNFAGKLGWTQEQQHRAETEVARVALDRRLAPLKGLSLESLAHNRDAMALAGNLFAANCSTCHGADARGARGFPNLADKDWLYGGDPESIYQSIAAGRHGIMPTLGAALGKQGINEVAAYVFHLSKRRAPEDWVTAGKGRFEALCAGCHGADGKGNQALGAPNLTDTIWLHGSDLDTVTATIANGRDNEMPAHLDALGETKVRLLAAYVVSLSVGEERSSSAQFDAGTGVVSRKEVVANAQ